MQRAEIIVTGRVQGVFFRHSVRQKASLLNLTGWVRNENPDKVHIIAEGSEEAIKELISFAKQGPPAAEVHDIDVSYSRYKAEFNSFSVKY
ncbi:acylphosphatase [Candidatus Woesearchaeota archaeon]|nr:acylphosphatase [Candidatus Woesearchaeota archaeon]